LVYDFTSTKGRGRFLKLAFKDSNPNSVRIKAFLEYLKRIKVKSLIVEEKYIDKDYLIDYANYYARCFTDYGHECKRIHFFKTRLTNEQLEKILTNSSSSKTLIKRIKANYLGFMVIKPIPTSIGKTCLKVYPESNLRKYPTVRDYFVNLFGISLQVSSLAYQEQDGSVAVCASSALWSAAQKTSELFKHRLPSPSQITKLSTAQTNFTRNFPNNGLTIEQLGVGISRLGLEPQIYTPIDIRINKMIMYAYLRAGIPIICGLSLFEVQKNNNLKLYAEHAVTVAGYSFEDGLKEIRIANEVILKSSSLTRIFCHDDQLCPFARMKFDSRFYKVNGNITNQMMLTSWKSSKNKLPIIAKIDAILIPLYNKIRISIQSIYAIVNTLEFSFQGVFKEVNNLLEGILNIKASSLTWDIYLSEVNDIKREIIETPTKSIITNKSKILKAFLPKYIWRAAAYYDSKIQFELLFDATDIEQGKIYLSRIDYSNEILSFIRAVEMTKISKAIAQNNTNSKIGLITRTILKDI